MPLPPPAPREEFHLRRVECRGFRRADGLWDIEGRIVDTKSYAFDNAWRGRVEPGTPLHDMTVRITIDESYMVHDAVAVTDASPFRICPEAADAIASIKGLSIGRGWTRAVKERLGGTRGCTHIMELLGPMATTAVQTLVWVRRQKQDTAAQDRPVMLDTCYAYASGREVVKQRWPQHYTGDAGKT
jgi:hypothetical protein